MGPLHKPRSQDACMQGMPICKHNAVKHAMNDLLLLGRLASNQHAGMHLVSHPPCAPRCAPALGQQPAPSSPPGLQTHQHHPAEPVPGACPPCESRLMLTGAAWCRTLRSDMTQQEANLAARWCLLCRACCQAWGNPCTWAGQYYVADTCMLPRHRQSGFSPTTGTTAAVASWHLQACRGCGMPCSAEPIQLQMGPCRLLVRTN